MTTSSDAETEAVPMRNRGYEADSTSTSGPPSAEVVWNERSLEEAADTDGGRETLPLLASRPWFSAGCRRRTGSSKEVFTCHLCSFVGTTRESFDQHMVDCHYVYRCIECSYSARTQGRLKRHLRDTHRKNTTTATTAGHPGGPGRLNPQRPAIGDQQKKTRQLKTIRCKYCKFITVEKSDFWRHLADHIPLDKQLRCSRCPFVTDLKHHHEYHLRSHDGFKPFLCQKCGYSCVNKSMLNSHSKSHSNVYRFRCAVCSFAAKYSHALKLHILKYGHSAGPVLNQDGSLPVAVGTVPPSAIPVLRRDGNLSTTQVSGFPEHPLLQQVESFPVRVMSAPVERQFSFRNCNFSTPTCSAISVPVTLGFSGRAVLQHDGNLSLSTSLELIEDTNSRQAVVNDYAGHPSVTAITGHCSKEKRKHMESPIEVRKKNLLEGVPSLDPPLSSVRVSFPSLTVPSFQFSPVDLRCATVSSDENILGLSSLLQRQRRVLPSLLHPLRPDLSGSDNIRFYSPIAVASGKITTDSTETKPFQNTGDYSTSTLVPSLDPESGFDHKQPLPLPGSAVETDTAEIGEFISMDTRLDNVEIEEPLDLTNRKGFAAEASESPTPTFWDAFQADELTSPLPPATPSHQVFSPATFPSSSSISPINYHREQTLSSYLSEAGSYHSPPPLLQLSLTLPRNVSRDRDRFQLNEKGENIPVLTSPDPDHSGDEDHRDYPPSTDHESSPVELEKVDESAGGRATTDSSFEGREFECRHCRMIFEDYVMFSIHSDHHGYLDPFECNMCGEKCEDRIQFFLHISRVAHD